MTIEQRLQYLEIQNETIIQQNRRIERKNKRLLAALTLMMVAICAVATIAATGAKNGEFDQVTARHVIVKNDAGKIVVGLGANNAGDGLVVTQSAQGNYLVSLSSFVDGQGRVTIYQPNGKRMISLSSDAEGNGGMVSVYNRTGEAIASLAADEYGNGVVGVWDPKGKGQTIKPWP